MNKIKAVKIGFIVIFTLVAATYILPLLFMGMNSFKSNGEFIRNIWALPARFYMDNFSYVFKNYNIGRMFLYSIITTLAGIITSVIMVTITAYAVARFKFAGRKVVYTLGIFAMLIPGIGTLSATYKLYYDLKILNTFFSVIISYMNPFGMNFLIMYSFFKGISHSYAEAAKIDGASEMTIFLKIMLPFAGAGIAVISLMSGISYWNDYFTPYMYMPELKTLATGLQDISNTAENRGTYTQMFAAMIISIIPVIAVYAVLQKRIINNVSIGGLKG